MSECDAGGIPPGDASGEEISATATATTTATTEPRYGMAATMLDSVRSDAVIHALLVRGDASRREVLLMLRARTGRADGTWAMPAGRIEPNETLRAAVVRELREELDVGADASSLAWFDSHHDGDREHHVVRVGAYSREPRNAEPERCDDVRWFAMEALPSPMVTWVRETINRATNRSSTHS